MKRSWPRKAKGFDVPIYDQRVYVITARETARKCDLYLHNGNEEWNVEDGRAGFVASEVLGSRALHAICILHHDPTVIVHEVTHLAMMICRRVHLHIDVENQEPFAYLVDYLHTQVTKLLGCK